MAASKAASVAARGGEMREGDVGGGGQRAGEGQSAAEGQLERREPSVAECGEVRGGVIGQREF